jgi:hypothetical protein
LRRGANDRNCIKDRETVRDGSCAGRCVSHGQKARSKEKETRKALTRETRTALFRMRFAES